MTFARLSDRLLLVANASLALCRNNFGSNGLRRDEAIHPSVGWKPTFYMRQNRVLIVAIEVSDRLYPEVLKIAAHDIEHYDYPIAVYQACSLDVYQHDSGFRRVNLLREHGFGIITVDTGGAAHIQVRAGPLGQYIPIKTLEEELQTLTPRLKVVFRAAHATYEADVGQGLQAAGQIIEAIIKCIAIQAEAAVAVPPNTSRLDTAQIIDALYAVGPFHNYRAPLGGARNFVRTFRNIASHPALNPQAAAHKIRNCKAGFLEALRLARELRSVIQALGYRTIIH